MGLCCTAPFRKQINTCKAKLTLHWPLWRRARKSVHVGEAYKKTNPSFCVFLQLCLHFQNKSVYHLEDVVDRHDRVWIEFIQLNWNELTYTATTCVTSELHKTQNRSRASEFSLIHSQQWFSELLVVHSNTISSLKLISYKAHSGMCLRNKYRSMNFCDQRCAHVFNFITFNFSSTDKWKDCMREP